MNALRGYKTRLVPPLSRATHSSAPSSLAQCHETATNGDRFRLRRVAWLACVASSPVVAQSTVGTSFLAALCAEGAFDGGRVDAAVDRLAGYGAARASDDLGRGLHARAERRRRGGQLRAWRDQRQLGVPNSRRGAPRDCWSSCCSVAIGAVKRGSTLEASHAKGILRISRLNPRKPRAFSLAP